MKQLLQNLRSGATQVVEVPIPTPRPGSVLVRTAASLVSAGTERMLVEFAEKSLLGKARSRPDLVRQVINRARREGLLTTLEVAFNRLEQPMPLGYSSSGTIIALGEGVQGFHIGQRVACAGGGYAVHAEFIVVPQKLLAALPDELDFDSAAFTTLGAISMHGFRLAQVQLGERVAVIGLGLLGLLSAGIARTAGCSVLGIDLDPLRVDLARQMGAEAVLRNDAEEAARGFSQGRGVDAVLICADTPSPDPVELAGLIARDRGHVVAAGAVGLSLPRKLYYEKELSFIISRSYGPGRYDPAYEEAGQDYPIGYVRWTEGRNLEAIVELLASGRLDVKPLITHRFPIERAPEAYELITGKTKEPFLGVLLTYPLHGVERDRLKVVSDLSTGVSTYQPSDLSATLQSQTVEQPSTEISSTFNIKTCNLGILGAGNFASAVLLPILKKTPGVELVGVVSASGTSAAHAARRYGFRYATSDEVQLLNDPNINTIAILTRHHLHARQVQQALLAGKHVFCEKPLALAEQELEEIAATVRGRTIEGERSVPLSPHPSPLLAVGFNRRFAPMGQKLQTFFAGRQEPLAISYRVNAGYIPPSHWVHDPAQGGGRILGEVCHFIDFLTFVVGAPPVSVEGLALPDSGLYRGDNAVLTFTFPDGSLGTVTYLANGDKAFQKERVEVFCAGRVAVLDDFRLLELVSNGKRRIERSALRQDKGHAGEWRAFVAAIAAGGPPPIPYAHLFGVTAATLVSLQALRGGERISIQSSW